MNERIRKLREQAAREVVNDSTWHISTDEQWNDALSEKFAELLLKDCVSNVKVWEKDSRNHISYMLKNHYDIEV
jgi:hypothetical protein